MNRFIVISKAAGCAVALFILATGCTSKDSNEGKDTLRNPADSTYKLPQDIKDTKSDLPIPKGAQILLDVYPASIKGYEEGCLIMADGSRILYDDGKEKNFVEMLDNSDPEDMFFTPYSSTSIPPEYLHDAGRSRSEKLFKSMYGNSESAVRKNLVNVDWHGETVKFTKVNGAADALRRVAADLAKEPELARYLKSSGTFYWRKVRGAQRLSAHSYGIAIDVGVPLSDYWLWKNPGASETSKIKYANRMPRRMVEIFEKHGFIWGGAWYHYDTMHFEYRPEILKNK
ncbi:MAG: M15 family metallopeptidase [Prevotella sp.]|nr:M15 family metallopeptidase [Bacteroides sp.]MCM1366038.1 M15 family metallopeptidase [Prevotella sp.]MCM1436892.1 M15 family metallopeptidase [Prevotella sp.]